MIKSLKKSAVNPVVTIAMVLGVFIVTLIIKKHQPLEAPKGEAQAITTQSSKSNKADIRLWRRVTVKNGDTLHGIFANLEIPQKDFWNLVNTADSQVKNLKAGQNLEFTLNKNHELQEIRFPLSKKQVLSFTRVNDHFKKEKVDLATRTITSFRSGEIQSSFGVAAKKAEIPADIYQEMVKIFAGKIDFSRDLRKGDHFAVLYDEEIIEGQAPSPSHIVATEMTAKHKTHQAVYFEYPHQHKGGYYTPDGKGTEGRFLNFPLKFKRISSRFNRHRMDPIIHKIQPHLGVDLAAPEGTPIHSIGDGRVIFVGQSRGYGNMVKVQYDRHYTALYAHMSRFAKNLKRRQKVRKGEVIGYVGHTGWATGPHLHFGFYVNGIAQDWLSLKHPSTPPVPRKYRKQFKKQTAEKLVALASYQISK